MLGLLLIAQSCSFLAHPKQETVFWAERAWKKSGGCPVLSLFSLLFLLFALVQENKNENSTMLQDKLPPERSTCMWPVDISSIYSCDAAGPGDLDQQLVRCRLPLSGALERSGVACRRQNAPFLLINYGHTRHNTLFYGWEECNRIRSQFICSPCKANNRHTHFCCRTVSLVTAAAAAGKINTNSAQFSMVSHFIVL